MSALVSAAGVAASFALDLPTGATIVATFGVTLLGVAALRRALRRERAEERTLGTQSAKV
jgi:ABC-type Mn2+/Zn2+ transport system permease subunit